MAATRNDINGWLDTLYADEKYTHMVVFVDEWDYEDYPVYVTADEDVREVAKTSNMQRVMEVYSRNHTREEQMAERRAFHYD